jgi:SGNH hydrolase-like domain, acetyltransferase AlgX
MYVRIGIICVYVLLFGICMGGIAYVIGMPSQHQLAAIDLVADGGRTIRGSEKNDQGVIFRWISDNRALTIAQPTSAGILTFNYWIAPNRVATAVHINATTIPLPPTTAFIQRRIAMLVFHADALPQISIAFQFVAASNAPIAWAFTFANWQTITPIPHYTILGGMAVLWGLLALSLQRVLRRHWVSMFGASVSVLCVIATQPVLATTATMLRNNPEFFRNCAVIVIVWVVWYFMHPRVVHFLITASRSQRLTIVLYSVLTLLPSIGMLFSPEPDTIVVEENRKLKDCPTQWMGDYWDIGRNFTILSQCISDHIGWRSIMIRSKNELDYRLFGVSSRVYFGNNNFYFLRRWGDERFPLLQQIIQDPAQHQQLVQLLQSTNATYAANNIHMILVIAPSKDILYPENLPWYAPRYDPQMVKNLEAELRATGMDVIPATDILQQHKHDVPLLYHQRDFHWNDIAAYYVAQEIVARIALQEQRTTPWPLVLPHYQSMWKDATDQHFAALLLNRDVFPQSYGMAVVRPGGGDWHAVAYANHEFVVWHTPVLLPQPTLPHLAIIGDSFSLYFREVGLEWFFDTIVATSGPQVTPATLQTFHQESVKYVVVQVRDVSLPLLVASQKEQ